MGVSLHYWAIPPNSGLYARLQEDSAFYTLMESFFPYGSGIYRFPELDPEELEETLDDVIQRHEAQLGCEPEARRLINEFFAELARTRAAFPGIERRRAMLEKCYQDVEDRLSRELQKSRPDAREFTHKLVFGDKQLAPHLRRRGDDILDLASLPVVRDGAAALEGLDPETLFGADAEHAWSRENYRQWRRMYLAAGKYAEEIVIGAS